MKVFGVAGWKNAGKTGLMERLVAEFAGRGLVVSTVKHAHHSFDLDQQGKDSFRHRAAGAHEVVLASARRWVLMHENSAVEDEATLADLLARMGPCDLVLVEGYKRDRHPKIEAHRAETGQTLMAPGDKTFVAVASDITHAGLAVPLFDLNDTAGIADLIAAHLGLGS